MKKSNFPLSTRRSRGHIPVYKNPFTPAMLVMGLTTTPAMAHIIPVDFGTFNGAAAATTAERNNGASANFGWIDGTDVDWADTHKLATYTFTLTGQAADVSLTFRGKSNAFGGTGMAPGFTLYQGVAHNGSDHDQSVGSELIRAQDCAATPGCTTTEGSFRALTTFRITNDADPTAASPSVFTYVGHAYDGISQNLPAENSPLQDGNPFLVPGADGTANNTVTMLFSNLNPGAYIVFVGGTVYANQGSSANNAARGIRGILSITPTAVPIPGAAWLFGSALTGFFGWKRRRPKA